MTSKPHPFDPLMETRGTEENFTESGVCYYAFGGELLFAWSGIKNPLCYWSLDPVSGQKSMLYCIKGLEKAYDRSKKLSDFQKQVWEHVTKYVLDTVGYLPGPKDNSKVRSVKDKNKSLLASIDWKSKFDSWDKKHDYEAWQFLRSSLSQDVKHGFQIFHESNDSFAATWLKLIHYLLTTTPKMYDKMKESI
jgi:hypothetical protein